MLLKQICGNRMCMNFMNNLAYSGKLHVHLHVKSPNKRVCVCVCVCVCRKGLQFVTV